MNNIVFIIIALMIIMILGFYKRKKDNNIRNEEDKNVEKNKEIIDYNQEFLENSEGKEVIPFIRIFAQQDKLMLRSLLLSEGICTYVTNENTNSLYPGVMIQGYTDTVIHIFKEDKEKARPVVEDYILNLIENIRPEIKVKAVDFAAVLATLPTSLNQIVPEIID